MVDSKEKVNMNLSFKEIEGLFSLPSQPTIDKISHFIEERETKIQRSSVKYLFFTLIYQFI